MKAVTVIVPVYGDWPSLKECITSLKQYVDTSKHTVMLVNDCGPEVDSIEKNIKEAIKDTNFKYFRNKHNMGFLKNCNNAVMKLDKTKNDILLLNSDTKVTKGFIDEMSNVLYAHPKHAAVSPRSNNATIATIPLSAAPQHGIAAARSYGLFQKLKQFLPQYNEIPTAHGFCMLIRRSLITKYGLFDEVFGKGYGEEVDFCQRVRLKGYKCMLANHAYVFHQEARSFSVETKSKLLEVNNKIIWERYPTYRQEVSDYMKQALVREERAEEKALGRSVAATPKKILKKLARLIRR